MAKQADELVALIESRRLTPIQRRIARRLVLDRSEVGYLSSGELALLAEVSQPSVSRFVRALGFASFTDFSRFLREHQGRRLEPTAESTDLNTYQRAITTELEHLADLRSALADPTELRSIARSLAGSVPLAVMGLRASAGLAHTFGYFAGIILRDVRVFTHFDSATQDSLARARAAGSTWMVALALPRYPTEVLDAARFAQSMGMRVLAVTDSPYTALTDIADEKLIAPVGTQLVFDSHVVPTMLSMALVEALAEALPGESQRRLEAFEESVTRRRVFTGP